MTIRSVMFAAPWLLVAVISSPLALAAEENGEPVQKPECPKGQVWDSKSQKCVLQTSAVHDSSKLEH
ncbi:carbohydrate-binding module family 14 protein [Pseudomonas retamae]|uniref:Carbohydrate-binding module family 14 protein n=1 Tax=Pseudomonas retamae TaxID=702110 RepID=A0ABW7D4Y5_9PSED